MTNNQEGIESILEEKPKVDKKRIAEEYIKENIPKNHLAFPLEVIPRSFKKLDKKEKEFIREIISRMGVAKKEYFNEKLKLKIDCYLEDYKVNLKDINKTVISLLGGIIFKKREQIREIKTEIHNVASDPCNDGRPFIGIVVKKYDTKNRGDHLG